MKYLSIKSFDDLQHYKRKDWSPPWIKLYNRLLDDYEFLRLSEIAQRHLICLWLLASRHDNRIPNDLVHITRAIHAKSVVDLDELIIAGFVIPTDEPPARKVKRRKKKAPPKQSITVLESFEKKSTPDKRRKEKSREESEIPASLGGNWVSEGVGLWAEKVAPIEPGRFGKALKLTVKAHGWPDTLIGLLFYLEDTEGKPRRVEWFANDAVRCIRLGKMPLIDESGAFTERGKLAQRSIARLA